MRPRPHSDERLMVIGRAPSSRLPPAASDTPPGGGSITKVLFLVLQHGKVEVILFILVIPCPLVLMVVFGVVPSRYGRMRAGPGVVRGMAGQTSEMPATPTSAISTSWARVEFSIVTIVDLFREEFCSRV